MPIIKDNNLPHKFSLFWNHIKIYSKAHSCTKKGHWKTKKKLILEKFLQEWQNEKQARLTNI